MLRNRQNCRSANPVAGDSALSAMSHCAIVPSVRQCICSSPPYLTFRLCSWVDQIWSTQLRKHCHMFPIANSQDNPGALVRILPCDGQSERVMQHFTLMSYKPGCRWFPSGLDSGCKASSSALRFASFLCLWCGRGLLLIPHRRISITPYKA